MISLWHMSHVESYKRMSCPKKGTGCWKQPQQALGKFAVSLSPLCISPFSSPSACSFRAGGNTPSRTEAPDALIRHQKHLHSVRAWLFTATGVCRASARVAQTPVAADGWGDYHQKRYPKEGKKAAKRWRYPAVKWQPSHRVSVFLVNCHDFVLRQLEVGKKAICFLRWKIKELLWCNPENSSERALVWARSAPKVPGFIWKRVLTEEEYCGKYDSLSLGLPGTRF